MPVRAPTLATIPGPVLEPGPGPVQVQVPVIPVPVPVMRVRVLALELMLMRLLRPRRMLVATEADARAFLC